MVYVTLAQTSQGQLKTIRIIKRATLEDLKALKTLEARILTQNRTLNDKEKKLLKCVVDRNVCLVNDPYDVDDLSTW